MENLINGDLDLNSSDESDIDTDNDTVNDSNNDTDDYF